MNDDPRYKCLKNVLERAFNQAAQGKGQQRHGQGLPFCAQPMQQISNLLNSPDGMAYQAIKKIQESQRMDDDAATHELLGAINYIAGIIVYKESKQVAQ